MGLLLRVLIVAVVLTALLSIVRGLFAPSSPVRGRRASPGPQSAGRLVKDPVCGTYIPEQSALKAEDRFFCSEECRSKFLSDVSGTA